MSLTRCRILFLGLVAWVGLAGLASCVSTDDAPSGVRVEHPDPGPKAPPAPAAPTQATSESSAHAPSPSEVDTQSSGFTLSPIDKAIRGDKPARPWSKNVPKRSCTKDDECGDGFCDRGRCAAIWTWNLTLGQRCERNGQCGFLPCVDGRCRSCVSDAECEWADDMQDPECEPHPHIPDAQMCDGLVSGFGPQKGIGKPASGGQ
jgi:hypothetical protein